ncbi:hypothetical protein HDU96_008843 [Phlyctochytrium bullatum]|nr:hypothetical protein HDU96_008843 [Phlyctochytrium bullatum]
MVEDMKKTRVESEEMRMKMMSMLERYGQEDDDESMGDEDLDALEESMGDEDLDALEEEYMDESIAPAEQTPVIPWWHQDSSRWPSLPTSIPSLSTLTRVAPHPSVSQQVVVAVGAYCKAWRENGGRLVCGVEDAETCRMERVVDAWLFLGAGGSAVEEEEEEEEEEDREEVKRVLRMEREEHGGVKRILSEMQSLATRARFRPGTTRMHNGHIGNGWPTPPTSPPQHLLLNAQQGGGAAAAQGAQGGAAGGWGGYNSSNNSRARSNSDLPKPSWDQVPGWSTAPSSSAAAAAAAANASWNPSAVSNGWSQVNHNAGNVWQNTAQKQSPGWAPVGWAPLPPAASNQPPASNWDSKGPVVPSLQVVTVDTAPSTPWNVGAAAAAPQQPKPQPQSFLGAPGGYSAVNREIRKAKSAAGLDHHHRHGAPNHGAFVGIAPPTPSVVDSAAAAAADAKGKKDKQLPASMRLFNRSFVEANKSLGINESEVKVRRTPRTERDASKAVGVYIYGLPKWVRVPEILAIFSEFGGIVNVAIVSKPRKEDQRAYAYVDYETTGSAARAIESLKDRTFFDMKEPLELRPHFDRSSELRSEHAGATASASSQDKPAVAGAGAAGADRKAGAAAKKADESAAGAGESNKLESQAFDYQTLHLGNLPQSVDKPDLEKLFSPFGTIRRIHIVQRPKDKKAFAFVSFKATHAAREAYKSLKDAKPFGMTEPLKIEYSRSDSRERSRTKVADKPSSSDKPSKKGTSSSSLAAPSPSAARGKSADGRASAASASTAAATAAPAKERRSSRTVIYARNVDAAGAAAGAEAAEAAVRAKFAEVGAVKSFHLLPRLVGTAATAAAVAGAAAPVAAGLCALIRFEKGEDAIKAVKEKVESAVFPRQRRLTVKGLPKGTTEAEVREWVQGFGEIRRVEVGPVGGVEAAAAAPAAAAGAEGDAAAPAAAAALATVVLGEGEAEIEFSKGDHAVVAFLHAVENGFKGTKVEVGYSPSKESKKEEEEEAGAVEAEADVAVAAEEADGAEEEGETSTTSALGAGLGEDGVTTHAGGDDYFGSSSEDETEVEVITLNDLEGPEKVAAA